MPKYRCHLPKKEGNEADAEAKKTKDGWDATFVFDGPTAPKGMVCKVIAPKAKPQPKAAGAELPKAVTAPAAEAAEVAKEQPKAASDAVPTEAETEEVIEVPAGRPADFPSPAGPQSVSNPSGGAAEFVVLATVTAIAGAMVASTFSNPADAKGKKGQKGKQSSKQEQKARLDQQRREREEKERKDCGASTEAVKADAQRDEQKFSAVLTRVNGLIQRLDGMAEDTTLGDLDLHIRRLTTRVAQLEARQQASSKRDSEPRTARRRQPKPDLHAKPDAAKDPRPRRT